MTLHKELSEATHARVVVALPRHLLQAHAAVPLGSVSSGRTYRTPDNRRITFAIPGQPIPEGPFHLVLHGWGHDLTPAERKWTIKWRAAAKG